MEYYRSYYRNGGTMDGSSTNPEHGNTTDTEKCSTPTETIDKTKDLGSVIVDGVEYRRYGM